MPLFEYGTSAAPEPLDADWASRSFPFASVSGRQVSGNSGSSGSRYSTVIVSKPPGSLPGATLSISNQPLKLTSAPAVLLSASGLKGAVVMVPE